MFTKNLEDIFSLESLKLGLKLINKNSVGIDQVSVEKFSLNLETNIEELLEQILSSNYFPEPVKQVEIIKDNKSRFLSIYSIRDKIVQKVLSISLSDYFDKTFSDKSYAYRLNKSPLKAINRVTNFINEKNSCVLKSDIKSFFDNIDQDILINKLKSNIKDNNILDLISLFVKNFSFNKFDYVENIGGIHQGDIISPLLSNIYLDEMDKYLEFKQINFVRFADDFIILSKSNTFLVSLKDELSTFLKNINLSLNDEKTYISDINKGFDFLGVRFKSKERFVENNRFQKIQSKIYSLCKTAKDFDEFIFLLNDYFRHIENYYLKIIKKDSKQFSILEDTIIQSIIREIRLLKESKKLTSKTRLFDSIKKIEFFSYFSKNDVNRIISNLISQAYSEKEKSLNSKINKKVNQYSKDFSSLSTIHLSEFGLFLGISKNQFVVKKNGKVIKSIAQNLVKRIVINNKGTSISSDVIYKCSQKNITIDFIDLDYNPFACIVTYNLSIPKTTQKQLSLLESRKQFEIALAFIKGKTKNQINYIKYLSKYHVDLKEKVVIMEKNFNLIEKQSKEINQLMGYEGIIASIYWECFKDILDKNINFTGRQTRGAKDIFNSCLNYGYAILYSKIQFYLLKAGLSLNISFLHTISESKPTLVFDFIEEFRAFIVDRTIVSILNKREKISLDKDGLLTKSSRDLIAKNIYEKLGSYIIWRKERRKIENIIEIQAYNLSKAINDDLKYKPFIGKY